MHKLQWNIHTLGEVETCRCAPVPVCGIRQVVGTWRLSTSDNLSSVRSGSVVQRTDDDDDFETTQCHDDGTVVYLQYAVINMNDAC